MLSECFRDRERERERVCPSYMLSVSEGGETDRDTERERERLSGA